MHDWSSLSHVRWDCKYHIVFVPKYRQKKLYGKFRSRVGEVLRDLCRQRGVELLEGHLMPDHIHMCLSVPPKYSIAFVIGFLKGKSAVLIHRTVLGKKRVSGLHFWALQTQHLLPLQNRRDNPLNRGFPKICALLLYL